MSKQAVWLPRRVRAGVISETLGDGTAVVVQLGSQQAHSLDALAARVWELADGTRSVTAVALAAGVATERVAATLAQLDGLGLLEEDAVGGHSRRSVLARAAQLGGGLVVAGGVINSMALPAAAAAVSQVDQGITVEYDSVGQAYGYYPVGGGGVTGFSSPVYLTDSGLVSSAAPPYVKIDPTAGGGEISLTFQGSAPNTASYGPAGTGTLAAATTSLMSGTSVMVNLLRVNNESITVTIGT